MATIIFSNNGITPNIKLTKELKNFLISIFEKEKFGFKKLHYVFCKDDYLLELNQQYLNHETFTDIITFTLSSPGEPIISEIYISIERVSENAVSLKIDYYEELIRVMIHGILHLCGYQDHTPIEKSLMRKKENYYLSMLGFT